jgi:hypothetical protein
MKLPQEVFPSADFDINRIEPFINIEVIKFIILLVGEVVNLYVTT